MIELLIVIAVLGVLAAVILIMLDPQEQLRRGRDAGRKLAVARLSKSMQAYNATRLTWPSVDVANPNGADSWMNVIIQSQELKARPPDGIFTGSLCRGMFDDVGYCFYYLNGNPFITVQLESNQEKGKCASGEIPYFMWSYADGKSGTICYNSSWTLVPGNYNFQP